MIRESVARGNNNHVHIQRTPSLNATPHTTLIRCVCSADCEGRRKLQHYFLCRDPLHTTPPFVPSSHSSPQTHTQLCPHRHYHPRKHPQHTRPHHAPAIRVGPRMHISPMASGPSPLGSTAMRPPAVGQVALARVGRGDAVGLCQTVPLQTHTRRERREVAQGVDTCK